MELTPNKLYQLEVSTTNYTECVGCIMRCCSHDRTRGTIVHTPGICWSESDQCVFGFPGDKWVEITEEQVMEVMLGG